MSRIEKILEQFEDFELAFLMKYKFDSYLEGSQKAILAEVNKRQLSKEKIENIVSTIENSSINDEIQHRCPRCKSTKVASDQVEFWNTYNRAGYSDEIAKMDGLAGRQTYKDKLTCMVCDYVIYDPNQGGFLGLQENVSMFFSRIFKKK